MPIPKAPAQPPQDVHAIRRRFMAALDALVEQLKTDRSVVAVLLGGSLSHDTVWAGSDIDLVLVTVDDRKPEDAVVCLDADGVNVHAHVMPRAEFRRVADGAVRHSFMHSFLAKGRLVYTHDPTIEALCARLIEMGSSDQQLQLLCAATEALPALYKAHKWLVTRDDLEYTALWILYAATPLAQIEVIGAGQLADREVIPRALSLNRPFFEIVYTDLLNTPKTRTRVQAALDAADGYMASRTDSLFAPVLDHLADVREARSCREIEDHFKRTFGFGGVTVACEYLADQGRIGRASTAMRLTKRSHVDVQELAFYALNRP